MKKSRLTMRAFYTAVGVISLSSLGLTVPVQGQDFDMTEIVVKPNLQGRDESLEDISISVTALDGDTMVEAGIGKIEDLAAYVPNFTMTETPVGNLIFIRGIGSGINQGFEQSVGIYNDGIYYGRSQLSRAPFLDLQSAEILRGPQVTLFGNNSVAGAVNLTSARPTDEAEFVTTLLYEPDNAGHGEREITTVLSTPITDVFGLRFAYKHSAMDGYMTNVFADEEEPARENHTGRLILDWEFDDWDMALKLEANRFDATGRQLETINTEATGYNTFVGGISDGGGTARVRLSSPLIRNAESALPQGENYTWEQALNILLGTPMYPGAENSIDYQRAANPVDKSDNESYNVTFNTSFNVMGDYTFKTTTGFLNYKYDEFCDCDFTPAELLHVQFQEDYTMYSQEFRLISPEDDVFDFIAGVYFQKDDLDYFEYFDIPIGGDTENLLNFALQGDDYILNNFEDPNPFIFTVRKLGVLTSAGNFSRREFSQQSEVNAIFGQGTFHMNDDQLRLILGARFTHTEKEASRYLLLGDKATGTYLEPFAVAVIGGTFNALPHSLQDKRTEDKLSFSTVLEWDVTQDALTYLSFTRGFKSGGFDVRSNTIPDLSQADPSIPGTTSSGTSLLAGVFPGGTANLVAPGSFEFEDEKVSNAEIGLKLTFGDSAILGYNTFNINYFYTEFSNLQVSTFDGTVGFNVGNAAEAVSQGVEVDFRMQLAPFYILGGALAYLDFRFNEYENGSCYSGQEPTSSEPIVAFIPGGIPAAIRALDPAGENEEINSIDYCSYSGQRNAFVPDWSGLISNNFFFPLNSDQTVILRTTFDIQFTTDFLTSTNLDPRTRQDAYAKLNTRISVGDLIPGQDGSWEVALLGRNLTDEKVTPFTIEKPLSYSQTGAVSHVGFVDRSRSVVLQGTYKF